MAELDRLESESIKSGQENLIRHWKQQVDQLTRGRSAKWKAAGPRGREDRIIGKEGRVRRKADEGDTDP